MSVLLEYAVTTLQGVYSRYPCVHYCSVFTGVLHFSGRMLGIHRGFFSLFLTLWARIVLRGVLLHFVGQYSTEGTSEQTS